MGIFRQHIAKIGIALRIVFSKVSLPVYVMRDEIPDNLLLSLDTNGFKSSTDGLVVPSGSPR
jgi:hypothetical protein